MTKVKAISVRAFELFDKAGASLGLYVVDDHWQGMTRLRSVNRDTETIIVDRDVSHVFGEVRCDLDIVKASPDLLVKLA